MIKMPIHCCCNPDVLLGVVPVPDGTVPETTVAIRRKSAPKHFDTPFDAMYELMEVADLASVAVRKQGSGVVIGVRSRPAIKSNDIPLEELRTLEGFEEFPDPQTDPNSIRYIAARERFLADRVQGYQPTISPSIAAIIEACGCDNCSRMKR